MVNVSAHIQQPSSGNKIQREK